MHVGRESDFPDLTPHPAPKTPLLIPCRTLPRIKEKMQRTEHHELAKVNFRAWNM